MVNDFGRWIPAFAGMTVWVFENRKTLGRQGGYVRNVTLRNASASVNPLKSSSE